MCMHHSHGSISVLAGLKCVIEVTVEDLVITEDCATRVGGCVVCEWGKGGD